MKEYKQLIKELPFNTIICAVGEFNPPTVGHELLVKTVKTLAEQKHSAHVIYTSPSKNSLIQEDKKVHYLNLMFPKTSFKSLNESRLQEVITELHTKYKKVIFVVGTDQIAEMRKLQNVELIFVDKDPEADNIKMKQFASKGIYEQFKKKLPSTIRDIDGKRLMNEMRTGLGLETIKEQIVFVKDKLREQYFRGEIFNEGDIVESNGEQYTIVKRGSNHLLLKESTGKLVSKWIQDVKPTEEKEMNEPLKLTEAVIQPNGTDKIDTKTSEPTNTNNKTADIKAKKGVITFFNYTKAQKIKEESSADDKKDNESDHDYEHQIKVTGIDQSEVGHTLVAAGGQDNLRRRKVKYHLGEATALEKFRAAAAEREKKHDAIEAKRKADAEQGKENMSGAIDRLEKHLNKEQKAIPHVDMSAYEDEAGHENTAQHIATNPEHSKKEKKLALSFIQKMQGVTEAIDPAAKAAKETAKATLMAKQAAEKEALATKQAREKEALKESHVEFRIDHRENSTGDVKSTFADHEAKVSDQSDKATYVKVPAHKADAFKSAMKSKHGTKVELAEAHKLGDKVVITKGSESGKTGTIGEIRDGAFKGAPKTYTVDHKEGSIQLKKTHIKSVKEQLDLEESSDVYKDSEGHLDKADKAQRNKDMFSHHMHMADYHDSLSQWHESKGRTASAEKHAMKAADHEEIAHAIKKKLKEETTTTKKKPLAGVVATAKPFDPFFENNDYDQTVDVATPQTAIDTSEEDDIDDAEIEAMIGNLSDEEIMDEYGEDELGLVDDETGEEIERSDEEDALDEQAIMEVLSRVERMKAKFRIRRTAAKRERATKIALKRYSNTATINKRARRLAIKLMKQRLLRGRDPAKISVGEKERIERTLEKRKAVIGRIATRLAPRVRKVEKARMSHTKYTQGSQQSVF